MYSCECYRLLNDLVVDELSRERVPQQSVVLQQPKRKPPVPVGVWR